MVDDQHQISSKPDANKVLKNNIAAGLVSMEILADSDQVCKLSEFILLLRQWNSIYNLTAIDDLDQMVTKHLLDSISISPYLAKQRYIDIGTGAGLPGIPLAIMMPQKHFVLLDSNHKKTRFLVHVKQQLQLNNIEIVTSRVEAYQADTLFDGVISRAFASLQDMIDCSQSLCLINGCLLAMKGQYPEKELREIEKGFNVDHCHRLHLPGDPSERHLVVLTKQAAT